MARSTTSCLGDHCPLRPLATEDMRDKPLAKEMTLAVARQIVDCGNSSCDTRRIARQRLQLSAPHLGEE